MLRLDYEMYFIRNTKSISPNFEIYFYKFSTLGIPEFVGHCEIFFCDGDDNNAVLDGCRTQGYRIGRIRYGWKSPGGAMLRAPLVLISICKTLLVFVSSDRSSYSVNGLLQYKVRAAATF